MLQNNITEIVATVLYIDNPSEIDSSKSLFREYGMTSLDFVDFAFELKNLSDKDFSPDDLWPINAMMADQQFFSKGNWTAQGIDRLRDIFGEHASLPSTPSASDLYQLFSVNFVEHRLRSF